jgi:hypothetical protein
MRSLLDSESKGWPWNSGYVVGSGVAVIAAQLWGLGLVGWLWIGISTVWLTVAVLLYRYQRKTRQT